MSEFFNGCSPCALFFIQSFCAKPSLSCGIGIGRTQMFLVCASVETKIAFKSFQPKRFLWALCVISRLKLAVTFLRWEVKKGRSLKGICCAVTAILPSYTNVIYPHAFFSLEMKYVHFGQ